MEDLIVPQPEGITITEIFQSLKLIYPELVLLAGLLAVIFWDLVSDLRNKQECAYLTVFTLTIGFLMVVVDFSTIGVGDRELIFGGTVVVDQFTLYMKTVFFVGAFIVTLFSMRQSEVPFLGQGEYYSLILSITLAACLLCSSQNLIVILLSFEFLSIPQYVLTGTMKSERDSVEGSLKYVIYGSVASGAMLFGFSLLYGFTGGQLDIPAIQQYFLQNGAQLVPMELAALTVILLLILAGIGFKISAVPFHMWTPDVYQGAPTPAVALFSIVPKAAGLAFFVRLFWTGFAEVGPSSVTHITGLDWSVMLGAVSVLSMTIGNLAALWQDNIKRLLAYSSIAHAGYILMGVVALTQSGLESMLFYIFIYMIMNLGIFVSVISLIDATGEEDISKYSGLGWKLHAVAIPMAVFLFSLTGLPPTAGFMAKFLLFLSAEQAGLRWLVIIALLNTVVSLYYYVKILKTLYIEQPEDGETIDVDASKILPTYRLVSYVLVAAVVGFFMFPEPVQKLARDAAKSFLS